MHPRLDIGEFRQQNFLVDYTFFTIFFDFASQPWATSRERIFRFLSSDVASNTVLHLKDVGLGVLDCFILDEFVKAFRAAEPEHEGVVEAGAAWETDLQFKTIVALEIDVGWGSLQKETLTSSAVAVRLHNRAIDFVTWLICRPTHTGKTQAEQAERDERAECETGPGLGASRLLALRFFIAVMPLLLNHLYL